jgi:hypothetical protein
MLDAADQHCLLYEGSGVMEDVHSYIIRLIATAMICWLACAMQKKDSTIAAISKLLCGVFMAITVISPLISFKLPNYQTFTQHYLTEAEDAAAFGQSITGGAMAEIIKQRCTTYILDKAQEFGAELTVEVRLTDDLIPVPIGVSLEGEISPYARLRLGELIANQLGIKEEAQYWKN